MKIIISLLILFFTMSCSEKENNEQDEQDEPFGFILETGVDFNLLNQEREDLLNPLTPDYFPVENMKLYYLINGEKIEVYDPLMDSPRNIILITETTPYSLRCFTYAGLEGMTHEENGLKIGISITYLELNEEVIDTIKTEWSYREDTSFVNHMIWYNGVFHNPGDGIFEVIK